MKFTFQNKNGTSDLGLLLPKPTWSSYKKRTKTSKRFGSDGAEQVGDDFVDNRIFTIDFEVTPAINQSIIARDLEYSNFMNNIVGFFLKRNEPFYIIDTDIDRRIKVSLRDLNDKVKTGLEKRVAFIVMKFEFLDGYWEDNTENEQTDIVTTGNTFDVDNNSLINTFTIFEIVPSSPNSDLQLTNQTTKDSFIIGSNSLDASNTLIMDGRDGTIFLDDGISKVETSVSLVDGTGFVELDPGINTFLYQSAFGSITITTKWRRRYAF